MLLASCGLPWEPIEEVHLILPEVPARFSRFGPHRFLLTYRDGSGREATAETTEGASVYNLELRSRTALPLLATPVFGGRKDLLFPAAGLYPNDVDPTGRLPLTWENGFAAEVLLLAESRGFPLKAFNAERFFREVRERGRGNPWQLDKKKILETLASLSFRADRITMAKVYTLSVPGLEGGWFSWNPFLEPFSRSEEGVVSFGSFPAGFHRFFRSDESLERLDVEIEENGLKLWTKFSTW